jgi:hypothetical protein
MMKNIFKCCSFFCKVNIDRACSPSIFSFGSCKALFFTLTLFLFPQIVSAADTNTDPPQQGAIYISGGAEMHGAEIISNAKIIVLPNDAEATKTPAPKKIAVPIKVKILKVQKIAAPKVAAPKLVFIPLGSKDQFALSKSQNTGNSVVNSTIFGSKVVANHYTALSVPVFSYLLKTYTADFSKTVALSHSFFSRPPPLPLG